MKEERFVFHEILELTEELEELLQNPEEIHSKEQVQNSFYENLEKLERIIQRTRLFPSSFIFLKNLIRDLLLKREVLNFLETLFKLKNNLHSFKDFVGELLLSFLSQNPIFRRFEKFFPLGSLLERIKFIDSIFSFLTGFKGFPISFPKSLGTFSKTIQKILQHTGLLKLTRENRTLATQVTEEVLEWVENSYKQIQKENPYFEEEKFFEEVKNLSPNEFVRRYKEIFDKLSEIYPKGEIQFSFFEKKLKELKKNFDENQAELLKNNFLKDWERELQKKKEAYEEKQIEKLGEIFQKELYERIENFEKLKTLLSPFTNDLARLWDLSQGVWHTTGFEILGRYAQVLEKEESIQKLAEMLGRYRKAEKEWEEEELSKVVLGRKYEIRHAPKGEVIGLKEGNQIHDVLPMELATLKNPILQPIFFKKFAEKKLLSYSYINQFPTYAEKEEKYKEKVQKDKEKQGPILLCIDTSGSMEGEPERIAKTVCFALTKIALSENRKCYLISFSTQIQTLELTDLQTNLNALVNFLRMSFHGETDATPALREALRMLQTENYKKADVLMISDFIMDNLPSGIVNQIQKAQENKTRFHSLVIGESENQKVTSVFDNNWVYDPQKHGIKELVKNLKSGKF